ncbi:MAG: penicillin acylase family protein [Leptospiraceae bacterium]|nr:penicillin acylase family protein [Leptospiraceae bacterium]MDW8306195.1 penicillin acylase family protein [Leptospiraceae bacterium]
MARQKKGKSKATRKPSRKSAPPKKSDRQALPVSEEELTALLETREDITSKPISQKRKFSRKIWLFAIALVFVAFIVFLIRNVLIEAASHHRGKVYTRGVVSEVQIRRDSLGVPYIRAMRERDLYFGIGYAMAEDRLWQMYSLKLLAEGRLAELMGEKVLELDYHMRLVGAKRYAERIYESLPNFYKENLLAFAGGVNEYLSQTAILPMEFYLASYTPERWSPLDPIVLYCLFTFSLSTNHIEELGFLTLAKRLGPQKAAWLFPINPDEDLPFGELRHLKDLSLASLLHKENLAYLANHLEIFNPVVLAASNNWVISGEKTKTGMPLLANDTHLQITLPSAWYMLNLESENYKASGVALPGVPMVALGYNGHIAWGATMVMADSQDVYIEKIKKEGEDLYYLDDGKWLKALERKEIFRVKGGDSFERKLYFTKRGPLIHEAARQKPLIPLQPRVVDIAYGLSLRQSLADGDRSPIGFYLLNKAKSVSEARQALAYIDGIYLNIVMSDGKNIAWQVTGRYPKREKHRGLFPVPGWDRDYAWKGYHSFATNPYQINPKEGFLVTANNKTTRRRDIHLSSSWYSPGRFWRAMEILSENKKFTRKDMHTMQQDVQSVIARRVRELLLRKRDELLAQNLAFAQKQHLREALLIMQDFEGELKASSASAAFYGTFWHMLAKNIFLDELGEGEEWKSFEQINRRSYDAVEDHLFLRPESPFWDDIRTPYKETREYIIAKSLSQSVLYLKEQLGMLQQNWQWGKIHHYYWQHDIARRVKFLSYLLSRGPYAAGGDKHTLNLASFSWEGDFSVWMIPAMRLVVDFSQDEPVELVISTGISGNPFSPHYDDMIPYFLQGKSHSLPMKRSNKDKQYTHLLMFVPAL